MKKSRLPRLGLFLAMVLALAAPPFARATEEAPAPQPPRRPTRFLSADEQEAMQAAIQKAQADGAARIAEIAAALHAAGYELEAATNSGSVFRVVSPRVSGTAPTVNLFLYPVGTTLEQMHSHGRLFSIGRDYNGPGAFAFTPAYGHVFARDLPPIPIEQEVLGSAVLQERVFTALAEFPEIRTTAPLPEAKPNARQRELSKRISKMDTLRRDVALWHAEAVRDQEAMSDAQRHRASILENLQSALDEAMGELQKERLGESPAPR